MKTIYTIGHSRHSIEKFTFLLKEHSIQLVSDVRSYPFSRFNPQFSRQKLDRSLEANGIQYKFLGIELGARPRNLDFYRNGKVSYDLIAKSAPFLDGIASLEVLSQGMNVALMCAEQEPLDCHRTILVSRQLVRLRYDVQHIHSDGALETHDDAMSRLCANLGIDEPDLLRSRMEMLDEAYQLRSDALA